MSSQNIQRRSTWLMINISQHVLLLQLALSCTQLIQKRETSRRSIATTNTTTTKTTLTAAVVAPPPTAMHKCSHPKARRRQGKAKAEAKHIPAKGTTRGARELKDGERDEGGTGPGRAWKEGRAVGLGSGRLGVLK